MIGFPSDVVPSKKDYDPSIKGSFDPVEKWSRDYTDAIIGASQGCYSLKDRENFAYAQGSVPESDFDYITKLYANPALPDRVLPGRIRQINSISYIINKIVGKYTTEELDYSATVVNREGYEEKKDEQAQLIAERLARFTRQKSGINEILGQPIEVEDMITPEHIDQIKGMDFEKYKTESEINVSKAVHWLLSDSMKGLQYKLTNQLLYYYIVTGKMGVDVYRGVEDPEIAIVHPEHLIYDLSSMSPFIQKGRYAGYYYTATPQEIIDKCPELTQDDVDYLESIMENFSMAWGGKDYEIWLTENCTPGCGWFVQHGTLYIECYRLYWKALKWVRVKITPNKMDADNPHIHFIGEGDTIGKNDRSELRCTTTLWECTKLGGKIYYQCREIPNQIINEDTPSERELPMKGIVDFNPCLVDILKPLEAMKISAFYSIDRLVGQAKGNILIVDEASENDSTDNYYNMTAHSVWRTNSAIEGYMQLSGGRYMEPKVFDMGMSKTVTELMNFVGFLDATMIRVSGTNEAYMGIINADTGLGTQQNAIQQAQLSTYPFISSWYNVIQSSLQEMCDLLPICWRSKDKVKYYIGARGAEFFQLKTDSGWHMHKYGLVLQNKIKAINQKNTLMAMAQQLLPTTTDPTFALALIKMVNAPSVAEAEEIFEKGVEAINKLKQEQMKVQQEQFAATQQTQMAMADKQAQIDMISATAPMETAKINWEYKLKSEEQKLRHKEDEMTVKYQNEIGKSVADAEISKTVTV